MMQMMVMMQIQGRGEVISIRTRFEVEHKSPGVEVQKCEVVREAQVLAERCSV